MGSGPPGGPGFVPGGGPVKIIHGQAQLLEPASVPPEAWSDNWLAYSRYDGVVVTGEDFRALLPEAQTALWQYVETGGCLLVLGREKIDLPPGWVRRPDVQGFTVHQGGFGECLQTADLNFVGWPVSRWTTLNAKWLQTAQPWQARRSAVESHQKFPVVDNIGVPVKGLFALMLLFAVAIGPANLYVLGRKRRRIWMLWTVPAISAVTCLAVFGYMLLAEGWEGHLRTEGLTLLDDTTHRATSIGWTAFYSPLTPGDGLHFGYDTEVVPQRSYDYGRSAAHSCTLDWTNDQHLAQGWVEARVPAHFKVRKSEVRRERLTARRAPDGTLTVVNGLGADVVRLRAADENGILLAAEHVAAGAQATLRPTGEAVEELRGGDARSVFTAPDWLDKWEQMRKQPATYLRPGTYLAELDAAPFFEDGLRNARGRKYRSLVLGTLKPE
jgi:hypothetical protein